MELDVVGWDIDELPDIPVDWVWHGYLARGNATLLAAPPKAGKSTFVFHLLGAIARGVDFLGRETSPCKALMFVEDSLSVIKRRSTAVGGIGAYIVPIQPALTWAKLIALTKLKANDHQLVIVDTVSRFWPVADEWNATDVLRALGPLLSACRGYNFALLLVHHTRKAPGPFGASIRGANAFVGAVDIVVELSRLSPWDVGPRRRLSAVSRYGDETPDSMEIELTPDGYVVRERRDNIVGDIMGLLLDVPSLTVDDVSQMLGISVASAHRILTRLIAQGALERSGQGTKRSPYKYSLRQSDGG